MSESRNGIFWRGLAAAITALLISVLGYYVHLNDQRWEEYERWKADHEKFARDAMIETQSRLARIEEKVDALTKWEVDQHRK